MTASSQYNVAEVMRSHSTVKLHYIRIHPNRLEGEVLLMGFEEVTCHAVRATGKAYLADGL